MFYITLCWIQHGLERKKSKSKTHNERFIIRKPLIFVNLRIKFKVKSSVISDSVTLWWKLDVLGRKRPLYSYVLSDTRKLSSWEKNLGGLQCVITCKQNKLLVKLATFKRNIPPVFPRQICWKRLGLLDRLVCDDWTREIFPNGMNIKFSFCFPTTGQTNSSNQAIWPKYDKTIYFLWKIFIGTF